MTASPETDGIVGWVVGLMEALGAPGVGLAIALENVFPPLPSEVFLPLAGFAAARGELSVVAAILWSTLGSLVGALVLYGLGAGLGRERLRAIADRMPLVDVGDIDRAEEWFARHGAKAVFFGRMIPLVRSMISVPAGVERMPVPLFAALTTAGSLIWNSAFVLAGYLLGENWHLVEQYAGVVSRIVLVLVVAALGWLVVRKVRARRAGAGPVDDDDDDDDDDDGTVPLPRVAAPGIHGGVGDEPTTAVRATAVAAVDGPTVRLPGAGGRRPGPAPQHGGHRTAGSRHAAGRGTAGARTDGRYGPPVADPRHGPGPRPRPSGPPGTPSAPHPSPPHAPGA